MRKIKLPLAPNWRKLHKTYTVVLSGVGSVFGIFEVVLPHMGYIQPQIPEQAYGWILFAMSVAIGVGRYIKQESVEELRDDARNL